MSMSITNAIGDTNNCTIMESPVLESNKLNYIKFLTDEKNKINKKIEKMDKLHLWGASEFEFDRHFDVLKELERKLKKLDNEIRYTYRL